MIETTLRPSAGAVLLDILVVPGSVRTETGDVEAAVRRLEGGI